MTRRIEMTPEERRALWKAGLELPTTKVVQPKWQPIETAPKDGTKVLLWNNGGIDVYWWHKNKYDDIPNWINESGWVPVTPTHWMALPAPPDIIGEQIIREEEEYEIRRELDFEDEFPHGLEGDE